jgi:signal peptide peptidase SppA
MSKHTARLVMEQFNARPSLIAARFASPGVANASEVTSMGLLAALADISAADAVQENARCVMRRQDLVMAYGFGAASVSKPFAFAGGKAIIPMHGMLINRFSSSWGFVTGYNFVQSQLALAMDDPDVDGIVYDANSYGGTMAGCAETAEAIFAASARNGGKPSIAVIDSSCYSAAYYLCSGADSIAITPTGGAGSIGVMLMHADMSKMLDEYGIKITMIYAGDHKVDGNPYEPLTSDVKDSLQADIDKMYGTFVATVARNRPKLTEQAVRDTQARTYWADDSLTLGLVDAVYTPPAALAAFFTDAEDDDATIEDDQQETADDTEDEDNTDWADDEPDREEDPQQSTTETTMTTTPPAAAAAAATKPTVAQVTADARAAERTRAQGILNHAEAAGRTKLANHLAFASDMEIEAAAAVMATAPKEVAAVTGNAFREAMATGNPNVGGNDGGGEGGEGAKPTAAQRILAAQEKAYGGKPVALVTPQTVRAGRTVA